MSKENKSEIITKQAVVLAAGESSRFTPFQRDRHKSTFSIFGESIISQTIRSLEQLGFVEVIVAKSPKDKMLEEFLAPLKSVIAIHFVEQEKPLGMGNALLQVKGQLKERFLLVNPQQINIEDHLSNLKGKAKRSEINGTSVTLFSQETDQPEKYGMLSLDGNSVRRVVEKPKDLSGLSNQRILGIYILTKDFLEFMEGLPTSEYQLEEALDKYSRKARVLAFESKSPALSLKYAWDLFLITSNRFKNLPDKPQIHIKAQIDPTAKISGQVIVEEGAQIHEYSLITGPCYIGKNVVIGSFCKVRKETVLEEGVELQNSVDVKRTIIGKGSHIHSGFIGDSIIGENVRIGANFITANRRLDRQSIYAKIKGVRVDTHSTFFGSLIGDNVSIGIHCGTNPGVIIPAGTRILPGTIVKG